MPIILNGTGTISGLTAGGLPSSSVTTANIADNAVTYAKIGTTEQGQLCKAWVNFNGTSTVAIRASYNVSSITDNGTGDYTVNFTTALPDANYSVVGTTNHSGNAASNTGYGASISIRGAAAPTTSAVRIYAADLTSSSSASSVVAVSDPTYVNVAIFR